MYILHTSFKEMLPDEPSPVSAFVLEDDDAPSLLAVWEHRTHHYIHVDDMIQYSQGWK